MQQVFNVTEREKTELKSFQVTISLKHQSTVTVHIAVAVNNLSRGIEMSYLHSRLVTVTA